MMRSSAIKTQPESSPAQTCVATAPGRVNLIGEHTDYTGGLVLPMAIPFTTRAAVSSAPAGFSFQAAGFEGSLQLADSEVPERSGGWTDYPVGVLTELRALGIEPPPFVLRLSGDVPLGAGLSSSASVEVATAMALLAHTGAALPPEQIALLCQRAENRFVGSPCGIMDQFVITAATAGHALMLQTHDLTYQLLPMNTGALAQCVIVVANCGVRHSVADGEYGVRRRELEAGEAVLQRRFGVRDLGQATPDQLAACEAEMSEASFKRCRHVITENARVLEAREAMLAGDAPALGEAMTHSHASQRDDFECSVDEIDSLVRVASALPGCYGARLTGGGFGGCTVNLVEAAAVGAFVDALRAAYRQRFDLEAATYVCEAVDGAVARAREGNCA